MLPHSLMIMPESSAVLEPMLFGPVARYAFMAQYGRVYIDTSVRHDKRRKQTHRYDIADTRGVLRLTVPVAKPEVASPTLDDIKISDHGNWWQVHRTSLESAYGRTPFFEFYIDRLLPLMQPQGTPGMPSTIGQMLQTSDKIVRDILGISTEVIYDKPHADVTVDTYDPDKEKSKIIPYYQVRHEKLGFIAGLSILDLIFNMGTEAPLILRDYNLI